MIFLLTGASHTGKTVLSQRLLERLKVPYLSIDHLKMGLIRSGQTDLTPSDEGLTAYLWPIVREIVKTAIENRQNLIVEGCYIPFDWAEDFPTEYRNQIRYCCLVLSEGYVQENFHRIQSHASDLEHRIDDACSAHDLLRENAEYLRLSRKFALPYLLIETYYDPEYLANILQDIWEGRAWQS